MTNKLSERTCGVGSEELYLHSDDFVFTDGGTEPIVILSVYVGGEVLEVQLNDYALEQFSRTIRKAEKWLKEAGTE